MQEAKGILHCYKFTPLNATGGVRIAEVGRGKLHRYVSLTSPSSTRDQFIPTVANGSRVSLRSRSRPASASAPSGRDAVSSSRSRKRRSPDASAELDLEYSEYSQSSTSDNDEPRWSPLVPAGTSDQDDLFVVSADELLEPVRPEGQAEHIIQQSSDTDEFASIYESELLDDADPAQLVHQHGSQLHLLRLASPRSRLT